MAKRTEDIGKEKMNCENCKSETVHAFQLEFVQQDNRDVATIIATCEKCNNIIRNEFDDTVNPVIVDIADDMIADSHDATSPDWLGLDC